MSGDDGGCSFCPGDSRADHRLSISADEPSSYSLSFGTMLRPGRIKQVSPGLAQKFGGGRVKSAEVGIEDRTDMVIADGPIRLTNTGDGVLVVNHESAGREYEVRPGETVSTSCPMERRRKAALGVLGGGLASVGLSSLRQ